MVRGAVMMAASPTHFPHTRGDGPRSSYDGCVPNTFSPHAWGWSDDMPLEEGAAGIFPTRVGMVRGLSSWNRSTPHFPHTRGDGPLNPLIKEIYALFSPHAWGWSAVVLEPGEGLTIFPTRVGMVRLNGLPYTQGFYFPHTRGDGPLLCRFQGTAKTFSPHAWGWSALLSALRTAFSIFPTRVGMVRAARPSGRGVGNFPHTRGDGPYPPAGAGGGT